MRVAGYDIVTQTAPTIYFIGVTTGQSSALQLFPTWAKVLGLDRAQIFGVDLPLQAEAQQYRQAVAQIKYDPLSLGALVTTHKLNLIKAARDLFNELDPLAQLCGEISCISKSGDRVVGQAKDPITAGRSLQAILKPGYWKTDHGQVLCLGAGGAATAIVVHFMTRADPAERPDRIIVVDIQQSQLNHLQAVIRQLPPTIEVETILNDDPQVNDRLMAAL
ncbi:MAG TPA: shikimate dehydrogenase, partial [Anaerolineae bacterium]|nr:shikimate dehydrogenase [Anaerolineae bacterium]